MDRLNRAPRPRAFTLVELLVVIAIIGILVALLLPAVQSAREAARRSQCLNNVRNIALALHNFHDTNGALPAGMDFGVFRQATWGWGFHILPFVEQTSLHDDLSDGPSGSSRTLQELFQDAGGDLNNADVRLLQTRLELYRCPSDNSPDIAVGVVGGVQIRQWLDNDSPEGFFPAVSNYVGSKGFFTDRNCRAFSGGMEGCNDTGVLFIGSEINFRQITDGLSNTFLIGERDERCDAGTWVGSPSPPDINRDRNYWTIASTQPPVNRPEPAPKGQFWACERGFSSPHPGGSIFALCDASSRFITEDIDSDSGGVPHFTGDDTFPDNWPNPNIGIYQQLGSRNDGVVGSEF